MFRFHELLHVTPGGGAVLNKFLYINVHEKGPLLYTFY